MNVGDIRFLLGAICRTLEAIKEFPVFEEVIEDSSYYTMSDLTMGDAIQALNEVVVGIENVNDFDQFSDLYLTSDLKEAITSLGELGMSVIRADGASRPSENKAAGTEAATDIVSRGECNG